MQTFPLVPPMSADTLQAAPPNDHVAARQQKIPLTTARALVRFLAGQCSVRDGRRQRLIPAILGICGHGNVAGLGQSLGEYHGEFRYRHDRSEQSLVHIAAALAKASRRNATPTVTSSIGPARRTRSPAPCWRRSTGCRCCGHPARHQVDKLAHTSVDYRLTFFW